MQSVESVSQEISQKRKYLESFAPKLKELVDASSRSSYVKLLTFVEYSSHTEADEFTFFKRRGATSIRISFTDPIVHPLFSSKVLFVHYE